MGSALNTLLIMAPEKFVLQGSDLTQSKQRQQHADIKCRLCFKNSYGLN